MPRGSNAEETDWVERLRDLRRLMGWSQRRLAKELRVTPGAVSQWEAGLRAIPGPVQRLVEVYERSLGMIDSPAPHGLRGIEGSWTVRTLRTSATAGRVAGLLAESSIRSLVASNARATEIKAATDTAIAEQLAEALGEMKGLLMKVGQIASQLDFAVPEGVRIALSRLQADARPMTEEAVISVFEESMGTTPERIFARFEARPFAAASIGQVHRAELRDGTPVAVKVQYPGVRRAIRTDLKNLAALDVLAQVFFREQSRGAVRGELQRKLLEECDYRNEADNQETFRNLYADSPELTIPRVHRDVSTDRILTTDYIRGRTFDAFVREADQVARNRAGENIFRFAIESIFRHKIFNADPHPGNYLFLDDGGVAFLDFGCVKRFTTDFVRRWAQYATAVVEGRRSDADRLVVLMGFTDDLSRIDRDYHHAMMARLYRPWASGEPFRFHREYVERNWRAMMVDNPNKARMRLPPDFLFVNRLQWGLHSVLADLGAEAEWKVIFDANVALVLDGGPPLRLDGRPTPGVPR